MVPRPLLVFVLAAACTSPLVAGPTPPAVLDPKVHDALAVTAAFYAGKKTIEGDVDSTVTMAMSGMKQEMDSTFHLALARPSSFSFVMQTGMMGGFLVCDGKTSVNYLPALHKYTSMAAPDDVSTLFEPMNFMMVAGSPLPIGISTFLRKDPVAGFGEELTSSQDLGTESLNGVPAHHVHLVNSVFITDLWLAEGSAPVLLQTQSTMDLSASLKNLPADQKKKLPANVSSMTMHRMTTFSNWKFDLPIAPGAFVFQPPADAQLVTEFVPRPPHPLVGQPAPDFTLNDLHGKPVALSSMRGQVVVLDFWATWCGPCVASLPLVTASATSFQDKGVVFYGVNDKEKAADIRSFQTAKNLSFPVLLDSDGKITALYKATGIPQTVLIDKTGKIQAVHVGYDPNIKQMLTQQLTDILAGKALASEKAK